jgi:hypothetical protein
MKIPSASHGVMRKENLYAKEKPAKNYSAATCIGFIIIRKKRFHN